MKNNSIGRLAGVSGLMRVKDEEEYVEASIDSVIDALDELIICYQECSDRTPEILERKQKEYPDKIKLYFYAPKVYSHNLTPEEVAYACSLPEDSPHLLSSYYNFTLSKATFRYAVKIDADQIYFTERMKEFCEAYRTDKRYKISLLEKLVAKCLSKASGYKRVLKKTGAKMLSRVCDIGSVYKQYIVKRMANEKCLAWLSGISLYRKEGGYYAPVHWLYNGTQDHCFFEITEDTYYYPAKQFKEYLKKGALIESFHYKRGTPELFYGFMWYHMNWCKRRNQSYGQDCQGIECNRLRLYRFSQLSPLLDEALKSYIYYSIFQDSDLSYPIYFENKKI